MPEGKCRRWATERRVATVGQNCVWVWGFLSEIPGLSRRLGAPTRASLPVEPGVRVWIDVRAGRQRASPLPSLYIHFVFCISYFVLYFLFSISTGPAHCAHVCGRMCGLIDLCSLPWQVCTHSLYSVSHILYCICIFYLNGPSPLCPRLWNILSILCSIVTWRAGLGRLHLL